MKNKKINQKHLNKLKIVLLSAGIVASAGIIGTTAFVMNKKYNNNKTSKPNNILINFSSTEGLSASFDELRMSSVDTTPPHNWTLEDNESEYQDIIYTFNNLINKFDNDDLTTQFERTIKSAIDKHLDNTGNYQTDFRELFAKWDEFKTIFNKVYKANVVLLVKNFEELRTFNTSIKNLFNNIEIIENQPQTSAIEVLTDLTNKLKTFYKKHIENNLNYQNDQEDFINTPFIKSAINLMRKYKLSQDTTEFETERNLLYRMIDDFQMPFKRWTHFQNLDISKLSENDQENYKKFANYMTVLTKSVFADGDDNDIDSLSTNYNIEIRNSMSNNGDINNILFNITHDSSLNGTADADMIMNQEDILVYYWLLLQKDANIELQHLRTLNHQNQLEDSTLQQEITSFLETHNGYNYELNQFPNRYPDQTSRIEVQDDLTKMRRYISSFNKETNEKENNFNATKHLPTELPQGWDLDKNQKQLRQIELIYRYLIPYAMTNNNEDEHTIHSQPEYKQHWHYKLLEFLQKDKTNTYWSNMIPLPTIPNEIKNPFEKFIKSFNKLFGSNVILLTKHFDDLTVIADEIETLFVYDDIIMHALTYSATQEWEQISSKLNKITKKMDSFYLQYFAWYDRNTEGKYWVHKNDFVNTPFYKSIINLLWKNMLSSDFSNSDKKQTLEKIYLEYQNLFKIIASSRLLLKNSSVDDILKLDRLILGFLTSIVDESSNPKNLNVKFFGFGDLDLIEELDSDNEIFKRWHLLWLNNSDYYVAFEKLKSKILYFLSRSLEDTIIKKINELRNVVNTNTISDQEKDREVKNFLSNFNTTHDTSITSDNKSADEIAIAKNKELNKITNYIKLYVSPANEELYSPLDQPFEDEPSSPTDETDTDKKNLESAIAKLEEIKNNITSQDSEMVSLKAELETEIQKARTIIQNAETEKYKSEKTVLEESFETSTEQIENFNMRLNNLTSTFNQSLTNARRVLEQAKQNQNKNNYGELISNIESKINDNETISNNDSLESISQKTNNLNSIEGYYQEESQKQDLITNTKLNELQNQIDASTLLKDSLSNNEELAQNKQILSEAIETAKLAKAKLPKLSNNEIDNAKNALKQVETNTRLAIEKLNKDKQSLIKSITEKENEISDYINNELSSDIYTTIKEKLSNTLNGYTTSSKPDLNNKTKSELETILSTLSSALEQSKQEKSQKDAEINEQNKQELINAKNELVDLSNTITSQDPEMVSLKEELKTAIDDSNRVINSELTSEYLSQKETLEALEAKTRTKIEQFNLKLNETKSLHSQKLKEAQDKLNELKKDLKVFEKLNTSISNLEDAIRNSETVLDTDSISSIANKANLLSTAIIGIESKISWYEKELKDKNDKIEKLAGNTDQNSLATFNKAINFYKANMLVLNTYKDKLKNIYQNDLIGSYLDTLYNDLKSKLDNLERYNNNLKYISENILDYVASFDSFNEILNLLQRFKISANSIDLFNVELDKLKEYTGNDIDKINIAIIKATTLATKNQNETNIAEIARLNKVLDSKDQEIKELTKLAKIKNDASEQFNNAIKFYKTNLIIINTYKNKIKEIYSNETIKHYLDSLYEDLSLKLTNLESNKSDLEYISKNILDYVASFDSYTELLNLLQRYKVSNNETKLLNQEIESKKPEVGDDLEKMSLSIIKSVTSAIKLHKESLEKTNNTLSEELNAKELKISALESDLVLKDKEISKLNDLVKKLEKENKTEDPSNNSNSSNDYHQPTKNKKSKKWLDILTLSLLGISTLGLGIAVITLIKNRKRK